MTNDLPPLRPARLKRRRAGPFSALRASFLTGLIVIAPIGITVWLIWALTGWMDSWVLPLIPPRWRPENHIGINLRGLGVLVFLVFTLLIGSIARIWIGRAAIAAGEALVTRVPFIGAIYGGLKQIAETILSQGDDKFDRACLIEYPRKGLWAVAFVSTSTKGEVLARAGETEMMSVFLPTTPNPTSGFLLFVPKADVIELDMTVEEAAKLIISAGLVTPPTAEEISAGVASIRRGDAA